MGTRLRVASCLILLAATAVGQEAPTVDELRAALKNVTTRSDALDEIARYWEGRDELEPDVRALVLTDWRAAWALGTKREVSKESIDELIKHVHLQPTAGWALGRIGTPAVPAILRSLEDTPEHRELLYEALRRMGPDGRAGAPAIARGAIQGYLSARNALGAMAPVGAPLLDALIQYDATEDLELLCCVGPHAFPRMRQHPNQAEIVMHLANKPYGFDFFRADDTDAMQALSMMMIMMARPRNQHVPRLIESLPSDRSFMILGLLDAHARQAEGALMRYVGTEHERSALSALADIGVARQESIRRLRRYIGSARSRFDKHYAVNALIVGNTTEGNDILAGVLTNEALGPVRDEILQHLAVVRPELVIPELAALG